MSLSVLACLAALGAAGLVDGIYLPDADASPKEQLVGGVPDDYRTLGEDMLHGILDSYDPYVIDEYHFNKSLPEITASGWIIDMTITGLSGFKANKLSLQGGSVVVDISLPSIAAVGKYNMTGDLSVAGLANLPLDGKGQIEFGLSNLALDLSIQLGISDKGQITLDECELTWNMSTIKFQMNGLLGGAALGSMINGILADALPHLVLKAYHDQITTFATTAAADFLPTIHQDHGSLPPDEVVEALTEHSRAKRAAASAEDIRALFKDEPARAEEQDSDGPVMLGQLLSVFTGVGHGAEDGDGQQLGQLLLGAAAAAGDSDDTDSDGSLLRQALSMFGLQADQLDLSQLVSFEQLGETQFLKHGELSGQLSDELSGEQDLQDDGLLESLASLAHGLGFSLTETKFYPHGALERL